MTQSSSFLPRLRALFGARPALRLRGVHDQAVMEQRLEIERARALRADRRLAVLVFVLPAVRDASDGMSPDGPVIDLAERILQRIRSTDEVGWIAPRMLGVILPDTPAEGAQKVADDILAACPGSRPESAIYYHPSTRDDEDETNSPRETRPLDEMSRDASEASSNYDDGASALSGLAPAATALLEPTPPRETERLALGTPRRVLRLDALFAQPLPWWKRALDIAGALAGLALAAPVLFLAAVAIKLTSRGPVFYAQRRTGLGGKPFRVYKLRTMVVGAHQQQDALRDQSIQDGPAFKVVDDPRVTPVGQFLRKTSLDELPQLWNILRGEMSLVGPRPLPCAEANACLPWQQRRHDVTPGLTCIWQVWGRSRVSFDEWIRMDLAYVANVSPLHDMKLIAATVPAVIAARGAS